MSSLLFRFCALQGFSAQCPMCRAKQCVNGDIGENIKDTCTITLCFASSYTRQLFYVIRIQYPLIIFIKQLSQEHRINPTLFPTLSINNVTPDEVCYGQCMRILKKHVKRKRKTVLEKRGYNSRISTIEVESVSLLLMTYFKYFYEKGEKLERCQVVLHISRRRHKNAGIIKRILVI